MTVSPVIGVVLLSYGSPSGPEDVERYYTDIRRGRAPTPEQVAELTSRYEAIGGLSPLAAHTQAQVNGVARALESAAPGRYVVRGGAKHSPPFIEDAVKDAAAAGAEDVVAVVLAPHYSALSVGEYLERVEAAAAPLGVRVHGVKSWHLEPGLIEALAQRVKRSVESLSRLGRSEGPAPYTIFTAHSLPARVRDMGDPYPDQLAETAAAVAKAADITDWTVAWQSAARTPEPWLGPDVVETIGALADRGVGGVVVCPAGFTSDHLEVLYDLDVVARAAAEERGMHFAWTASLNDDPALCETLAGVIMSAS